MKKLLFLCLSFFSAFFMSVNVTYAETGKMSVVSGQIILNDRTPIINSVVLFFNDKTGAPPDLEKYWRIPDAGAPLTDDGRFTINLVEGVYYLGVIKKPAHIGDGQPSREYWLFISSDEDGKLKRYVVNGDKNVSLGVIHGIRYDISSNKYKEAELTIEGVVSDAEGNPVKDVIVEAFITKEEAERPIFSSGKTGSDGKYFIRVQEGTYYLKIRKRFLMDTRKNAPVTTRIIYVEKEPVAVTVKRDEVAKRINLTVADLEKKE